MSNAHLDERSPAGEDVATTRQCGRCRLHFPIDAGVHPIELLDWWTCPACADALMPGRQRPQPDDDEGGPT